MATVFSGYYALGTGITNAGVFSEISGGSYARLAVSLSGNQIAGLTQAVGQFVVATTPTSGNIYYQAIFDGLTGGNLIAYWAVNPPFTATTTAYPATTLNITLNTWVQVAANLAANSSGQGTSGSFFDVGAQLGTVNGQPMIAGSRLALNSQGNLIAHLGSGQWVSSLDVQNSLTVGGLFTGSYQDGLTALSGGGQTGATQILANTARVTTVAAGNDSVILPACTPGTWIALENGAASNSMNVFPDVGSQINAVSANGAFAMAAAARVIFVRFSATRWFTVPLVAS